MQDIFDADNVIEEIKLVYQEMRKGVEEYFNGVFLYSRNCLKLLDKPLICQALFENKVTNQMTQLQQLKNII